MTEVMQKNRFVVYLISSKCKKAIAQNISGKKQARFINNSQKSSPFIQFSIMLMIVDRVGRNLAACN